MRNCLSLIAAALISPAALAQSINIDFGLPGAGPAASYGAAGQAGVWNSIEGEHTPFTNPQVIYELVDLDGQPTGVTLYQFGGTELIDATDPSVSGDDAILLQDALVTHSSGLETCLWINGLEPGTYEVLVYGWMPNQPDQRARVRHDFQPERIDVGGAWPGQHEEGVTYARHIISTNGFIGSHSGNLPGADLVVGAAMNGMQLRKMVPCPNDLDDDDTVGFGDVLAVLTAWGPCVSCPADLDGDDDIGFSDLLLVLAGWGPCP